MVDRLNYIPYYGNTYGLAKDTNHINFRWNRPGCKVLFSAGQAGSTVITHVYSDGKGDFVEALNDWVEFVFWIWDWCKMIIGAVTVPKVTELAVEHCGFILVKSKDGVDLIVRRP